jgi:cytochrome c oxidase assembly protein subunit 20
LLKRNLEKANMKRAVEIIDFKKAEREAKLKAAEERRKAQEEAERMAEEAKRRSWKFW